MSMRRGSSGLGSDGLPISSGGTGARRFAQKQQDKHATAEQVAQKAAEAKVAVERAAAEQVAAEQVAAAPLPPAPPPRSPQRASGTRRASSGRQQLGSDGLPISGGARLFVPKQHAEAEPEPESPSPPPQQQQRALEGLDKFCGCELKPRLTARPLSKFVDGTVIFIVSYVWYTLFAHYLLSLNTNPSCSGLMEDFQLFIGDNVNVNVNVNRRLFSNSTVGAVGSAFDALFPEPMAVGSAFDALFPEAFVLDEDDCDSSSAAAQALFALSAIVLGALFVALVCKDSRHRAVAAVLPKVIGMMVGWAGGAALKVWMQEISSAVIDGQCTGELSEWQTGACGGLQRRLVLASLNLLVMLGTTAASALIMLTVNSCFGNVELGDSKWQDSLENALMMIWRLCSRALTVSSAIAWAYVIESFVLIEASSAKDVALRLALSGLVFTSFLAWRMSIVQARIDTLTDEVKGLEATRLGVAMDRAGWLWMKARAEFYRLVESSSGWLVGCLWTDVLFAFTREWITSSLHSGLLAITLLLFACGWLLIMSEDDTLSSQAATVTRYFVTNALSFVVGWACVLVFFDLQPRVEAQDDRPHLHQLEAFGIFLLFGPALTYGPTAWSKCPGPQQPMWSTAPEAHPTSASGLSFPPPRSDAKRRLLRTRLALQCLPRVADSAAVDHLGLIHYKYNTMAPKSWRCANKLQTMV